MIRLEKTVVHYLFTEPTLVAFQVHEMSAGRPWGVHAHSCHTYFGRMGVVLVVGAFSVRLLVLVQHRT